MQRYNKNLTFPNILTTFFQKGHFLCIIPSLSGHSRTLWYDFCAIRNSADVLSDVCHSASDFSWNHHCFQRLEAPPSGSAATAPVWSLSLRTTFVPFLHYSFLFCINSPKIFHKPCFPTSNIEQLKIKENILFLLNQSFLFWNFFLFFLQKSLHNSKIICNFAPENDSKAKVSSLTHFAEAEFGNVNVLMLNSKVTHKVLFFSTWFLIILNKLYTHRGLMALFKTQFFEPWFKLS